MRICEYAQCAGSYRGSLKVHPDRQHLVYSLGCTVVVEDMQTHKQVFLAGHTNAVTCTAISKSGKMLASGQVTHMGFKADILVWDFEQVVQTFARINATCNPQACNPSACNPSACSTSAQCASQRAQGASASIGQCSQEIKPIGKLTLHKVKVQAVAFAPSEKYLVSLGGEDDGTVVVWSLAKKEAICGSPAQTPSSGITECLAFANNNDRLFFTAGEYVFSFHFLLFHFLLYRSNNSFRFRLCTCDIRYFNILLYSIFQYFATYMYSNILQYCIF